MKRFWTSADSVEVPEGWAVHLDGRPVKTPARREVVVPVPQMADRIAAEWDAQEGAVNPLTMPMTRFAATCLDRVAPEQAVVAANIASYGETDLLCYRADRPIALIQRQAAEWDPVLDWADQAFGARLRVGAGVMHVAQAPEAVAALAACVATEQAWALTALAELTTLSGSLVLALGVRHGHLGADRAWHLSRIDEQWNIDEWGEDHEAAQQAARKRADFLHAAEVLALLDGSGG